MVQVSIQREGNMWLESYRCVMCSTEETIENSDDWTVETNSINCPNCEWPMDKTGNDWGELEDELFADYPEDTWVDPAEMELVDTELNFDEEFPG